MRRDHCDELFIKQCVPGVSFLYNTIPHDSSFVIDSRIVRMGDIFVAIPGSRNDGHDFVADAVRAGAAGLMIRDDRKSCLASIDAKKLGKVAVVVVHDTVEALCAVATAWRARFSYPIVGITGSMGKTSTKETVAAILKTAGTPYLASHGNQNTRIGAALNILKMRDTHEVAVFEMGINQRGEMAQLARMIKPTVAVITSIGHCHMEGLGSLQDIAAEKREIFKYFTENNIGIIHGDQPLLTHVSYQHPVIKFGFKTTNQVQARKVRVVDSHAHFVLKIYKDKFNVSIPKPHAAAVNNVLAAAAVAHVLNIPHDVTVRAVQQPVVVAGRFEQRKLRMGSGILINDSYNANPESMKAALAAFEEIETPARKIVVIGDMLELGVNSPFWHRQIGRFLRKIPSVKQVILVGSLVEWTKKNIPIDRHVLHVPSWKEAVSGLQSLVSSDPKEVMVLVKGSLGMGLLNLVKQCTHHE